MGDLTPFFMDEYELFKLKHPKMTMTFDEWYNSVTVTPYRLT